MSIPPGNTATPPRSPPRTTSVDEHVADIPLQSPPELAGFKVLLEQLVEEFHRVEAWAKCIHNDRCVGSQQSSVSVSSHANGNSLESAVKLPEPAYAVVHKEHMDSGCIESHMPDEKMEKVVPMISEDNTAGKEVDEGKAWCIAETEDWSAVPQRDSALAIPRDTALVVPEHLDQRVSELEEISEHIGRGGRELRRLSTALSENRSNIFDEENENVCVNELKMWFQKLLKKETTTDPGLGLGGARALSPAFIHSLFIATDGDHTQDKVSVREAVNALGDAVKLTLAHVTNRRTCTFSSTVISIHQEADTSTEGMLDFDSFVELLMWSRVEPILHPRIKKQILQIREVLIRHSVDELIFEFSGLTPAKKEQGNPIYLQIIEPTVGLVVFLNALTIGISSDHTWEGWESLEFVYTIFFFSEVIVKLCIFGARNHFMGPDAGWNIFDLLIVSLAIFDLGVTMLASSDTSLGNFTLMRLARLAKITRLLRLIRIVRLRCFKELLLLVKGVVAGMRTLAWAFVLLATLVYIVGIMLRQTVGERSIQIKDDYNTVLFHSVPWSMFMTFRCFTDDCTLPDGTPVLAHLYELYGYAFMIPWSLVTLFVTFGVFNLIMAVFVENVQENAKMKRQLTRDDERSRVVTRMRELVMIFGGKKAVEEEETQLKKRDHWFSLSNRFSKLNFKKDNQGAKPNATKVHFQFGGIITRDMFNQVISQPEVHDILDDLEVHVSDRSELFDLLDADRSNSVDVSELIHGILKLRSGGADKSDIVATILGIRSLQKQIAVFMESSIESQELIRKDLQEHIAALRDRRSQPDQLRKTGMGELQTSSQIGIPQRRVSL